MAINTSIFLQNLSYLLLFPLRLFVTARELLIRQVWKTKAIYRGIKLRDGRKKIKRLEKKLHEFGDLKKHINNMGLENQRLKDENLALKKKKISRILTR